MENSENTVKRVALLGIIVTDGDAVSSVNALLHEYGASIVGRMGLPMRERNINTISLVLDASADVINSLTGKLGAIKGVSAKALFGKI